MAHSVFLQWWVNKVSMEGSCVPMILSVVLIVLWSASLSFSVVSLYYTVIPLVRPLTTSPSQRLMAHTSCIQ